MIIRTLRIGHFGKLCDKEINFSEGFNIIQGSNESGKSTIHAFIRGMLFGNEKQRGRTPAEGSLYDRYLPWDAPGAYSGSMDFEHNGCEYRITRVFFRAEKSCTLTEISSGRVIPLADDSITSFIPELTPGAYDNTVSAGQKLLKSSNTFGTEVKNFIANLATARDNEVDIGEAEKKLKAKAKSLKDAIDKCGKAELEEQYNELLEKEKEFARLESEAAKHQQNARKYADLLDELKNSDEYLKKDDYDGLVEIASFLRELQMARQNVQEDRAEYKDVSGSISELEGEAAVLEGKRDALDAGRAKCDTSQGEETGHDVQNYTALQSTGVERRAAGTEKQTPGTETQTAGTEKRTGLSLVFGIISVLLLGLSIVTGNLLQLKIPTLIVLVAMVFCVTAFTVLFIKERELKKNAALEAALRAEAKAKRQVELNELNRELAGIEAVKRDKQERLKRLSELIADKEQRLGEFVSRVEERIRTDAGMQHLFGKSVSEAMEADPEELRQLYADAQENKKIFAERENELNRLIDGEDDEEDRINRALFELGDIGAALVETGEKLRAVRERAESAQTEKAAVSLALSTLEALSEELHNSFGSRINRLLSREVERTTNGVYTQARVTGNFSIEVMGKLDFVPLEALSAGTQEQLWLALRFAVAELFFENVRVPILLDESFAYYDDDRLLSALSALQAVDGQILLFTCHKREAKLAAGSAINVITL